MNDKHALGLWTLMIMIIFSLAGCSANETKQTSSEVDKPFTKEIKELDVFKHSEDDETTSVNDQSHDRLDEAGALPTGEHLDDFFNKGYKVIEEQSFQAVLQPWGNVRFVSGYLSEDKLNQPMFHIVNSEQQILSTLPPDLYTNNLFFREIKAVSFKDMNDDGMTDIIVIGEYSKDSQGQDKQLLTSVYFSSGEMYSILPWYNDHINLTVSDHSIQSVVAEGNKVLKQISPTKDRSESPEKNLDALSSFICTDRLLATGNYDYSAISESIYLFSYSTTFSESYLPSSIGTCFSNYRKELLVDNADLKAQVEQYDQLMSDLSSNIGHYHYIETGGGTMWNIINAYSYLELEISLTQYARGNPLDSHSNNPGSQNELANQWSEFHDRIHLVLKNKYIGDGDDPFELSDEDLDQIKEIEQRLDDNMPKFIELVSNDPRAEMLTDWMMNKLNLSI